MNDNGDDGDMLSDKEHERYVEAERKGITNFRGARMTYIDPTITLEDVKKGKGEHATEWRNRRPICPYGCGQEGNLLEVIMRDGKAIGIYTHKHAINPFTADLQMSPKPTGRKIVIGPDGEPTYSEGTEK